MAGVKSDDSEYIPRELTLPVIKSLGGDEEDFKLISGNDDYDDKEEIIGGDDSDSDDEPLPKVELRDFIKKLGFKDIPNKLKIITDELSENDDEAEGNNDDAEVNGQKVAKVKKSKVERKLERDEKYKITEKIPTVPKNVVVPKEPKRRNYMLISPQTKWYENEVAVQAENIDFTKLNLPEVLAFQSYATKLLQRDLELYQKHLRSSKNRSDFSWIETVLKSGATGDKMAARITLVQDSPVHNIFCLEQLIKMIDVKRKRECLQAIDTLKDLFLVDLLLQDKKLRSFDQQPLGSLTVMSAGNVDVHDKLLILWHFESCLKQKYSEFVSAIVKVSHDLVDVYKRKALKVMFELLLNNPEQEQLLLSNIVNKLGDPNHKIASQTSYFLCQLLDKHPTMKTIVVNEVERLLFRPNVSAKASYFAVCFLNQIILDQEDKVVACKLTSIYFSLFRGATKKGEVDSKMMTALLTGANRAFPFAKLDSATISEHIDSTYKIIPTMNFNIGVQALTLLYHILDSKGDFSDRFYCSLYRQLLDPELKSTSKQTLFINLLYKSLKRDDLENRLHAFIKRIFQIAQDQVPAMACGLLFMVSEILRSKSKNLPLTHQGSKWEVDGDDEEEHFKDVSEDETEVSENRITENQPPKEQVHSKVSWVHRTNLQKATNLSEKSHAGQGLTYDPLHRNPLYAIVGKASFFELIKLSEHSHPSVALFGKSLIEGNYIRYGGDPLQDFTLPRFLDRFVYRNPKKIESKTVNEDNEGVAPVTSQRSILGKRSRYRPKGVKALSVDSELYIDKPEEAIPVDERFLYKYFTNKRHIESAGTIDSKRADEDDEDIESVASDEFETLLDKFDTGDLRTEYEIDFAAQMKKGLTPGKKLKYTEEDSSEGEAEDDDDEVDYANSDFDDAFKDFEDEIEEAKADAANDDLDSDDGEMESGANDDDEEFTENDNEDLEDDDEDDYPKPEKRKRDKNEDTTKYFAAAEDFSAALEENAGDNEAFSGLEAFSNKDNAHAKQLKWEVSRDQYVRGVDWKSRKRPRHNFSKKPTNNHKSGKFTKRVGRK
ncbi:hypothetical protein CHUAL_008074 [Chamberlinius hualienensis]